MSKGRFEKKAQRRSFSSKSVALMLACVLLIGGVIGGTVAWLTAKTNKVTNVFTISDIGVELKETTEAYKMVPGWKISKDPKAKVTSGSEDCYLFIKAEEEIGTVTVGSTTYSFDDFIKYAIDEKWIALDATKYPGVYYMVIDEEGEKNTDYIILGDGKYIGADNVEYTWADNEVLTKPEVTKEMMAAVDDGNKPTLSFTAYAVQLWKSNKPATGATEQQIKDAQFTAEDAWLKISPTGN